MYGGSREFFTSRNRRKEKKQPKFNFSQSYRTRFKYANIVFNIINYNNNLLFDPRKYNVKYE